MRCPFPPAQAWRPLLLAQLGFFSSWAVVPVARLCLDSRSIEQRNPGAARQASELSQPSEREGAWACCRQLEPLSAAAAETGCCLSALVCNKRLVPELRESSEKTAVTRSQTLAGTGRP